MSWPECEHIMLLRAYLHTAGIRIWSEHGEDPAGWVNVWCTKCGRTHELALDLERAGREE